MSALPPAKVLHALSAAVAARSLLLLQREREREKLAQARIHTHSLCAGSPKHTQHTHTLPERGATRNHLATTAGKSAVRCCCLVLPPSLFPSLVRPVIR